METAVWLLSAWVPLFAVAAACMVVIYGSRSLSLKNEIEDKELQLRAAQKQVRDLEQQLRMLAKQESDGRIDAEERLKKLETQWHERCHVVREMELQIEKLQDAQEKWETEKKRIQDDKDHAISVAREAVTKNRRLTDLIDRVNRQQSSLADAVRDAMKIASAYVQMIEVDRLEALENAEDEAARKKDEEDGEVTNGN